MIPIRALMFSILWLLSMIVVLLILVLVPR